MIHERFVRTRDGALRRWREEQTYLVALQPTVDGGAVLRMREWDGFGQPSRSCRESGEDWFPYGKESAGPAMQTAIGSPHAAASLSLSLATAARGGTHNGTHDYLHAV
jgi:hypothetical protein